MESCASGLEAVTLRNGDEAGVGLEQVVCSELLDRRGPRAADHARENRALIELTEVLANRPERVLQALAEAALHLCHADSAGISVLEDGSDGPQFVWRALAGRWAPYLGGTMPRHPSPCGAVVDCNRPLLMQRPQRHFPIPDSLQPPVEEVLLIPFHVGGVARGTVWIVAHDERVTFDAEDLRLMTSLARFAGTAWQLLATRDAGVAAGRRLKVQSEELQLLSGIPEVGLFRCGRDLRLRSANGTFAGVLGAPVDGLVGRPLPEMLGPGGFDALRPAVERVLAGHGVSEEIEVPLPQGVRHLAVNFVPDDDDSGAVSGWHATVSDVTARRRSERAAARSATQKEALYQLADGLHRARSVDDIYEAALRAITSALRCERASILLFDEASTMRFVAWRGLSDDYVRAATGHSPWRPEATDAAPLAIDDVDDADLEPSLRAAVVAEQIASLAFIPLLIGERLAGKFMAYSRLRHAFGRDELELGLTIARQLAFAIERHHAEQQLRDHAAELARIADTLRRNEEELQAVDRRKDEFLAMLAHELRNPLAPIATAVRILALARDKDPVQDQARAIIERQAERLTRLVDELLEVSRINTGRIQLRITRVTVDEIVRQAVETVTPIVAAHGHTLVVERSERALWIDGDSARLEQVLVNLLNNAAKYTNPGGRIRVRVGVEAGHAVIRVSDTGIGIEPDVLPHVFELFTQAVRALDRARGGLGIGLSLVRRLVEMHDGEVTACSTVGQGSEFAVRLPLAVPPVAQSPGAATPAQLALPDDLTLPRGLRVLVVDDNVDAAESLAMLLRASGHTVTMVHDGARAIETVERTQPELVLLDIGLPGVSGYDVARALRCAGTRARLVALTGYGQQADRRQTLSAGFDDHLVKPATARDIRRVLETVVTH